MQLNKLEAELIKLIQQSEELGEPLNEASWGHEKGILLTRQEAISAVSVIGMLKTLDATLKGVMTLKDLFGLVLSGYYFDIRPDDDKIFVKVMNGSNAMAVGYITKESMNDSEQLLSQFVMELINKIKS